MLNKAKKIHIRVTNAWHQSVNRMFTVNITSIKDDASGIVCIFFTHILWSKKSNQARLLDVGS
jgi:hypothetical protein